MTAENYLADLLCKDIDCSEEEASTLIGLALYLNNKKISDDYCNDAQMQYLYDEWIFPSIFHRSSISVDEDEEGKRHSYEEFHNFLIFSL